ncbi:MAG: hypothetical protein V4706_14710 [Pseudomonadota bacterium]
MGGKSESKTDASTSTSNTTTVTDRRTVADGNAVVIGDNSTGNSLTDHGAIAGAFNVAGLAADIANKSVIGATMLASEASAQQGKVATAAFSLAEKSAETIKGAFTVAADSAQGNRTLALAGLTLAAVVGLTAYMGKK